MNTRQVMEYFATKVRIPKLLLVEYTNTTLEFIAPFAAGELERWRELNQAIRSHYILNLSLDFTIQDFAGEYHERSDWTWREIMLREMIAERIYPLLQGTDKDNRKFQEYVYEDNNKVRSRIRIPIQEKYYPLKQSGIRLCQKTQIHHPTKTINNFYQLRFFERLQAGDFDVLGVAFDEGMMLQDLPYLDTDAPYTLSSMSGTIRSLREHHQFHLAYGLALKVRQEEREQALALAHPIPLYQEVPLRPVGKHKA